MFIQTEPTPNPLSLKFLPGRIVMKEGTAFFQDKSKSSNSPLAKRLFSIEGVSGVFFGNDFITITQEKNTDWQILKPMILGAIMDHYNSDEEVLIKSKNNSINIDSKLSEAKQEDNEIVKQIKDLLDTRIRPAVAMDGGDIVFQRFEKGIVYLHMQGACSGCPSSTATLKMGIENMLKHYVPEVKEIRQIDV